MIIEATERELQALAFLIDAAVKSLGVRGAGDAVAWIAKIEAVLIEESGKEKQKPHIVVDNKENPNG